MQFFTKTRELTAIFSRLTRITTQLMYGVWKIKGIETPIVSIFGGSRFTNEDQYAQQANILAKKIVEKDISVMTGGGPGIMEAASCGAIAVGKNKGVSIGIGVKELGEKMNPCVQYYFELETFSARKWLLTHYSVAFVVFPGGFGTLDELAEVLTLIQTNQLPLVPIVLIGHEYWHYFMKWLKTEALTHKVISEKDLELFTITDDLDEALTIICKACEKDMAKTKDLP